MPGTENHQANLDLARAWLLHYQERIHFYRTAGRLAAGNGLEMATKAFLRQLDRVWEAQENLKCSQRHWA